MVKYYFFLVRGVTVEFLSGRCVVFIVNAGVGECLFAGGIRGRNWEGQPRIEDTVNKKRILKGIL